MLAHPVHSTAVRIMATDAPVPGRSNMRARTEPPHFHVEIFAVDSKVKGLTVTMFFNNFDSI